MATASHVAADDSLLSKIDRALLNLETRLALISGLAVFGLMILAVVSVGGRNFLNSPIAGYVDWIEQFMPLIAFTGIAFVQREGGHIRMDMFIGLLRGRALWTTEFITTLLILLLMILMVWGSWAHFQRSFDWGMPMFSRDSSIDIGLPIWPAKLLAPIAFSVLCLRLIVQLWGYGQAIITGKAIAVPLIPDVAEQAAQEAAQMEGKDNG